MADLQISIVGNAPLICHNGRLADPLDPMRVRLNPYTDKRGNTKTEDDHNAIARLEFEGGLYYDEEQGPYVPGENVFKCLVEAGRLRKKGKEIERALIITREVLRIGYDGPRDIDGLYAQGFYYRKSVGVQKARTMRTRPRFEEWALSVPCVLDTTRLDVDDLKLIVTDAGDYIGLGERRPMFGRFMATVTSR